MGTLMTVRQFRKRYGNEFYKIVNPNGHNGLVYHNGLNIDPQKFNPSGNCNSGGIYFTTKEHIYKFYDYGSLMFKVMPKSDVWVEDEKFKTHELRMSSLGWKYSKKALRKAGRTQGNSGYVWEMLLGDAVVESALAVNTILQVSDIDPWGSFHLYRYLYWTLIPLYRMDDETARRYALKTALALAQKMSDKNFDRFQELAISSRESTTMVGLAFALAAKRKRHNEEYSDFLKLESRTRRQREATALWIKRMEEL